MSIEVVALRGSGLVPLTPHPPHPRTFETPGDVEEPVGVQAADVASVQPAVSVDGLACLVLHVQIAHEDGAAPQADLAAALCVLVYQLRPAAGHHLARAGGGGPEVWSEGADSSKPVSPHHEPGVPNLSVFTSGQVSPPRLFVFYHGTQSQEVGPLKGF